MTAPRPSERRRHRVRTDAAVGAVELGYPVHIGGVQTEIEDVDVLLQPFRGHGLGNDDQTGLDMPADDGLGGRLAVLRGDLGENRVLQKLALAEGAPGFGLDPSRSWTARRARCWNRGCSSI